LLIPAFEFEQVQNDALSRLVLGFGGRQPIAFGELLIFGNGPCRPEHGRGAVKDLVHVGIATVVHQAAGQVQTHAQIQFRQCGFCIVGELAAVDVHIVQIEHHAKLHKNSSDGQPFSERNTESFAE